MRKPGAGTGTTKKTSAVSKLSPMTKRKLSTDDINHMIESAVCDLKADVQQELDSANEVKTQQLSN